MANYLEPFEDTNDLFNQIIEVADLKRFVNITILVNNRAKDLYKITKANDLLKFRAGDDIIIVLNEGIFEELPNDLKLIVVEEAISSISYDSEHDKVSITKEDFTAHSGILRKYSFETIERLRETVKSLYQKEKEEEDETEAITG